LIVRLKRLIKTFSFTNDNRSRIALGAGARLHPTRNAIELSEPYSTAADIQASTWITNPRNVKQWLGFQAVDNHQKDEDGAPYTSLGYRIGDGTDQYWWDGGAWAINTTDWNTEAEIATNITTFPATSKQLQVIVNLVTTNESYTPQLFSVKVLYSSDIEFQEDLIWRSFIPELREQIRPISDWPIKITTAGTEINLNDYALDTPYNIVGIDSVFNHTTDPNHDTDAFSSYDDVTKIITVNSALAVGDVAWVRFTYEPEVAATTSQEYTEIAKVPAITIGDISLKRSSEVTRDDSVIDKAAGTAVKVLGPMMADVEMVLTAITASAKDNVRLADELKRFFRNNVMLRSRGLDEYFRLWMVDEYSQGTLPTQTNIHASRLRVRIVNGLFFERDAVEAYPVLNFHLTGDMNTVVQ